MVGVIIPAGAPRYGWACGGVWVGNCCAGGWLGKPACGDCGTGCGVEGKGRGEGV